MKTLNPKQPIVVDDHGVKRYKKNGVVRLLLDFGNHDLNKIAYLYQEGLFTRDDVVQFYQLIGYSVSGIGDLSEVQEAVKDGEFEYDD